jgi:hypothetical protein
MKFRPLAAAVHSALAKDPAALPAQLVELILDPLNPAQQLHVLKEAAEAWLGGDLALYVLRPEPSPTREGLAPPPPSRNIAEPPEAPQAPDSRRIPGTCRSSSATPYG